MLARLRPRLTFANVVSVLALFVALGGGAYAAATIDGSTIKKNSIPGNRLQADTVTGGKVKESSLARVPAAKNAANARTLAGRGVGAFGSGVVSGSAFPVPAGETNVPPYGFFNPTSASFFAIPATAPVKITLRDFVGHADSLPAGTVDFHVVVTEPGKFGRELPLCQVSAVKPICRATGVSRVITIPRDAGYLFRLVATGTGPNVAVDYQYRAAAG
jgi:hypothetical protein